MIFGRGYEIDVDCWIIPRMTKRSLRSCSPRVRCSLCQLTRSHIAILVKFFGAETFGPCRKASAFVAQ